MPDAFAMKKKITTITQGFLKLITCTQNYTIYIDNRAIRVLILFVYKCTALHEVFPVIRIFKTVHWLHIGRQVDQNLFPK